MSTWDYYTFNQVGPDVSKEKDPWFYCITEQNSYYSDFGDKYGGTNDHCRRYMADRCAKKWDQPCEIYSHHNDKTVPDKTLHQSMYPDKAQDLEEGKKHVLRTFSNKYCRFVQNPGAPGQCVAMQTDFNPIVNGGPVLESYHTGCKVICDNFAPNLNEPNDPVINKIIEDYELAAMASPLFVGLCKNAKENGVRLEGHLRDVCGEAHVNPDQQGLTTASIDMDADLTLQRLTKENFAATSNGKGSASKNVWGIVVLLIVLVILGMISYYFYHRAQRNLD